MQKHLHLSLEEAACPPPATPRPGGTEDEHSPLLRPRGKAEDPQQVGQASGFREVNGKSSLRR